MYSIECTPNCDPCPGSMYVFENGCLTCKCLSICDVSWPIRNFNLDFNFKFIKIFIHKPNFIFLYGALNSKQQSATCSAGQTCVVLEGGVYACRSQHESSSSRLLNMRIKFSIKNKLNEIIRIGNDYVLGDKTKIPCVPCIISYRPSLIMKTH